MARAGRRPGRTGTRERILAAARELFGQRGYEGTTIRAIAAAAEVNPALLHHFFGTKEQVFVAALNLPIDPATVVPRILDGPRGELGQRMVRVMLEVWRQPDARASFLALLRSVASHEDAVRMFRQFVERTVLERLAGALGVPKLRLTTAAAQVIGLALLRFVIGMEPLSTADEEEIVQLVAPVIQYYVDGRGPSRP
ncbi:TetR/AcrR family transcriptional regulator [Gandjariella thermophila]|uniref:TetR family transcriptional regulator n=1 Tax=Gandjariella thermophila TaxID=1931992 RepID=A0A4D4JBA6_9PSEU|nr:TetR family transcriptional regulator [Gandjariella thermophila]GDY32300.1 TetR family transcriptional regulator [Gandjariella thermophila]